eukprot:g3845.t1
MAARRTESWEDGKNKIMSVLNNLFSFLKEGKTNKMFTNKEYMETYTTCYNMCTQRPPYNYSVELYDLHGSSIKEYLEDFALVSVNSKEGIYILQEIVHLHGTHKTMNKWMKKFFTYLDRYHVQHQSCPGLVEVGNVAFKKIVFNKIKGDVVNQMLIIIQEERDGQEIDTALLKKCVAVFEAMDFKGDLETYTSGFEESFLACTKEFYAKRAQEWIGTDDSPTFLKKAEQALKEEMARVKNYLIGSTESKVCDVVVQEVLQKYKDPLLNKEGSGCLALLKDDRREYISLMYRMIAKVPNGLDDMAKLFKEYVLKSGNDEIEKRATAVSTGAAKDTASDPTFMKGILKLHRYFQQLIVENFAGDPLFQQALKEAFEDILGQKIGKFNSAELMVSYCDRVLRTGGEKLSEEQVERELDDIVQIFTYIRDKDLFADIYRNMQAKRLLNKRSVSNDAEKHVIGQLKIRCGARFTQKLEGMINDLKTAKEHNDTFSKWLQEEAKESGTSIDYDFSVQVLTTGFWPSYAKLELRLPAEMETPREIFKAYYREKHSKDRSLDWTFSLGNCSLIMKIDGNGTSGKTKSRQYNLSVTTLQTATLLLFNGQPAGAELSLQDVVDALNIKVDYAKRVLHSLTCGKARVLNKTSKKKKILPDDKFSVNTSFTSKHFKLRIPMASLEPSHNPKVIEQDRTLAIEAAIVRIMKARKEFGHQALIGEVMKQLAFFSPRPKSIKRAIEGLIDREYLERDPDQSNMYRYLA